MPGTGGTDAIYISLHLRSWPIVMLLLWLALVAHVLAKTHEFNFNASLVLANPDGEHERQLIGINGQWPLPIIQVAKNDRVVIRLTNGMDDRNALLHFHGLFMEETNSMDGPEMVTQCPIPPGHTFVYDFVVKQTGTYWYHSHLGAQYSDGLRGMFIVEENKKKDYPFHFDESVPLSVADYYHEQSSVIMRDFKLRYNPTGAEPIPQGSLFNDTVNAEWKVKPNTTYYLRIVNMGMFVSQYVYIENHKFVVVEIDGVYVEPRETDSLYIGVAQRYGVLLTTDSDPSQNAFRFVNALDEVMLDFLPKDLRTIATNYMIYDTIEEGKNEERDVRSSKENQLSPLPNGPNKFEKLVAKLNPIDDFVLRPVEPQPLLDDPDLHIDLNFTMETLGDGVVYAFFNGISYTAPKVPTLYTVLSSGEMADNPAIYGSNTNTFVLQHGEVVQIALNNMDPGLHPFHLHGHTFQVVSRSEGTEDDDSPQIYDPKNNNHTNFPAHPMVRDTVMVNANGFVVLRFTATNPGVWFFHCHVDWHLEQGLAITLVEAPFEIQQDQKPLQDSHFDACNSLGISTKGNAAGSYGDSKAAWLDLLGENVQKKPLPEGFTLRGYIAFVACAAAAIFGVYSVYQYGIEDISTDSAELVTAKLYQILEDHDTNERAMMLGDQPVPSA